MHLGIKIAPINVMHKYKSKYCIKLDLCKDSGLDEPVLALLRIGVSKVSFGVLFFSWVDNFELLMLLLLVHLFGILDFNSYGILSNVVYMKECRCMHEQEHMQQVI